MADSKKSTFFLIKYLKGLNILSTLWKNWQSTLVISYEHINIPLPSVSFPSSLVIVFQPQCKKVEIINDFWMDLVNEVDDSKLKHVSALSLIAEFAPWASNVWELQIRTSSS